MLDKNIGSEKYTLEAATSNITISSSAAPSSAASAHAGLTGLVPFIRWCRTFA